MLKQTILTTKGLLGMSNNDDDQDTNNSLNLIKNEVNSVLGYALKDLESLVDHAVKVGYSMAIEQSAAAERTAIVAFIRRHFASTLWHVDTRAGEKQSLAEAIEDGIHHKDIP
jgi:hypothetical protein